MKKLFFCAIAMAAMMFGVTSCDNKDAEQTDASAGYTITKAIDMEHHLFLPEFVDYLKTRTEYPLYNDSMGIVYFDNSFLPIQLNSAASKVPGQDTIAIERVMGDLGEGRIAAMDYAGVTTASLSTGAGIEMLPKEEAVKYARMTNDAVAAAVKKYPGRFAGTICLPMPYVEESVAELERAVNELGLSYWHTHANYGTRHLDEPEFEPVLAKCAELGVAFYMHPANSPEPYLADGGPVMASAGWGFGVEVMKVAIKLIIHGTFDRYPNLRMILGHMGEYFPYCLDRMNNRFFAVKGLDPTLTCKEDFTYYFEHKNIMVTTSGIFDPAVIECGIKTISADNIMLGTDYPYEDFKASVDFIKNLDISNEDKDKILYKNAEEYILNRK